jgi:hypothetical protein
MFHPHFLDLFFGNPHSLADTMRLVSAFKVEEDLQRTWREEREREFQAEVERDTQECKSFRERSGS